jgi:hypothetical protein
MPSDAKLGLVVGVGVVLAVAVVFFRKDAVSPNPGPAVPAASAAVPGQPVAAGRSAERAVNGNPSRGRIEGQ